MEDAVDVVAASNRPNTGYFQLGIPSFDVREQHQFGQSIRLAMACIEGSPEPIVTRSMPTDAPSIRQRLNVLSQNITSHHADLLELLVRFDDVKGWDASGSKHCVAWMNLELGIGSKLGWEYLKVGRQLRALPTTTALFRAGKLSWSKVRAIARVADEESEKLLCHAALDASVSDVYRLCREYQWQQDNDSDKNDNERAAQQWKSRSLIWKLANNGNTCIQLTLPPEIAQAFLSSVEHSLNLLNESAEHNKTQRSELSISARRADAAVLMAEASLQADTRNIAAADRYQVIVSVESGDLTAPMKKLPTVKHAGPIARETARRIACDCSITNNVLNNGEPVSIGRKSRLWPAAMSRAIKNRDKHCQFNGCTQTRNLQIHHIKHWADGGTTSIDNGVCLCQACHTKVHEGGYKIQRVENNTQRLDEQFARQQRPRQSFSQSSCQTGDQLSVELINIERELRDNRESFDQVRALLPTTYRFRIVDAEGRDIRDYDFYDSSHHLEVASCDSTRIDTTSLSPIDSESAGLNLMQVNSTRVEPADVSFTCVNAERVDSTDFTTTDVKLAPGESTHVDSTADIFNHPWFIAEQAAIYYGNPSVH